MSIIFQYINFISDYIQFNKAGQGRFNLKWEDRLPCLDDDSSETGFDRHYIYHPAWAARCLEQIKPKKHIDISSSLYFCSIVSAFIPVEFYDFRPPPLVLPNLSVKQADLTRLKFADNSIASLSCMHVIEHIGLGRYGDPLDSQGDIKAAQELQRVLASGGNLLIVVPVGKPRIQFNAHRIYSYQMVMELFSDLKLKEFTLVEDNSREGYTINPPINLVRKQSYGCGCFWFTKP